MKYEEIPEDARKYFASEEENDQYAPLSEMIYNHELGVYESNVEDILENLSKQYLPENHGLENYGFDSNGEVVMLGNRFSLNTYSPNECVLKCPNCGGDLGYDDTYSKIVCQNPRCNANYSFSDLNKMKSQN